MTEDDLPDDLASLAERLHAGRPTPSAALRRRLYERSLAAPPGEEVDRTRVRTRIARFASTGVLLLAIAVLVTFL